MRLNFDYQGYLFQKRLNALRSSFGSTSRALQNELDAVRIEASQYRYSLENGGEWVGETDEEGFILWDQESLLKMREDVADEAIMASRKAYIITAYHYWERGMQTWTNSNSSANYDVLIKKAEGKGLIVHPRLVLVRDLANALKHNKKSAGERLFEKWNDLFLSDVGIARVSDWYEAIRLQDTHVLEILDVVTQSGPRDTI